MTSLQAFSRRQLMTRTAAAVAAFEVTLLTARGAGARWPGQFLLAADDSNDLEQLATDAFIFAYPLVLMDITRQQLTAVPAPTGTAAPSISSPIPPSFRIPRSCPWRVQMSIPSIRPPGWT